jgi:transposase
MKVYSTVSGRRAMTDLRECQGQGHIAKAPHYNSIFHYLENPDLTPVLKSMVEESAAPLRAIETDFAVDSSGFSTSTFVRWYDHKYGRLRDERDWLKAHLIVGTTTNVVTGIEITGSSVGSGDAPQLPALVESTAKRFTVSEVSADKAYLTKRCIEAIHSVGATPYIPFKSNSKGDGPELWRRMWHFYQFNRQDFLAHYHKRSNVETTFSMIKAKFGGAVRSRKPIAQTNEILCKVICHNLCVLVQSIYELGIEPTFWSVNARQAS